MKFNSISAVVTIRFNRYMVECELQSKRPEQVLNLVLIDTWWNVNFIHKKKHLIPLKVLIDTWWNVN